MDDLEAKVMAKWGKSHVRDWTMVRTVDPTYNFEDHSDAEIGEAPAVWAWFCGTSLASSKQRGWLHKGYANTIEDALTAMLEVE